MRANGPSFVQLLLGAALTPIFAFTFVTLFLLFHPIIVGCWRFGPRIYRRAVDTSNLSLLLALRIIGTRFKVEYESSPSAESSKIFVSNHQSLFDIPLLLWNLRSFAPHFIAKRELGRGIPSLSHALRHMGSCLIDRTNRLQAVEQIRNFGREMHHQRGTVLIFPEGTRSRDGVLKSFKKAGLAALLEQMPDAAVIPVGIHGTWNLTYRNLCPVPFGTHVQLRVGTALARSGKSVESLIEECHAEVKRLSSR